MNDRIRLHRKQANTPIISNPLLAPPSQATSVNSSVTYSGSSSHDLSRIAPFYQRKLSVSQPGDAYEREADKVAQQVMEMGDSSLQQEQISPVANSVQTRSAIEPIQRVCTECKEETKEESQPEEDNEQIQAKEEAGQTSKLTSVQRKLDSADDPQSGSNLESQLNASKGGGSPLNDDVRSFMEPRFGADFSGVRVHTGNDAVQMNRDVNAQAFAHGSDIYFGAGKSPGNNELTAHELTHVVQQTGGVQTKQTFKKPDVQLKCAACDEEEKVQRSIEISSVSRMGVQRSWFGDEEDEKKEPENSSSGGVLDWAKEQASGAVDSVTQAGGDAFDWAKDKGGAAVDTVTEAGSDAVDWAKDKGSAAVDTVTQAGGDAVDWAKDKGGEAVDTVTQAGGDAVDWAKETGAEYSNGLLEQKKASLIAQINEARQKLSGQESISVPGNQIATLNNHLATLREKSQGLINVPGISAETGSTTGEKAVGASTIEALLTNLQSSISAPFMALPPVSSNSNSETIQGSIQRFAGALGGVALGLTLLEMAVILAIMLAIALLINKALSLPKPSRPEESEEEEESPKSGVRPKDGRKPNQPKQPNQDPNKVPRTGPNPLPNPKPEEDKTTRGGMRSQIQRGNDHLGSADVVAADSKKGVTAREFEQIAMIGALTDYRDRRVKRIRPFGSERNEKNITFAFAQQSKLIRGSIVPGGGVTQGGDINALRQKFQDAETGDEIRVDVENTSGHNLRFEE
jgi:hypothetical protein